jgi:hypothetical protein
VPDKGTVVAPEVLFPERLEVVKVKAGDGASVKSKYASCTFFTQSALTEKKDVAANIANSVKSFFMILIYLVVDLILNNEYDKTTVSSNA